MIYMSISVICITSTILIAPVAITVVIGYISTWMMPSISPARGTPILVHWRHKPSNRRPRIPVFVPVRFSRRRNWNPRYSMCKWTWRHLKHGKGWRWREMRGSTREVVLNRTIANIIAICPSTLHWPLSVTHTMVYCRTRFHIIRSLFLSRVWNNRTLKGDNYFQ